MPSPSSRARISVAPPAGNGAMRRTGFVGNSCASAAPARSAPAHMPKIIRFMPPPSYQLLDADAGLLDDPADLLDLRAHELREFVGTARPAFLALRLHLFLDIGQLDDARDFLGKLLDDRPWR